MDPTRGGVDPARAGVDPARGGVDPASGGMDPASGMAQLPAVWARLVKPSRIIVASVAGAAARAAIEAALQGLPVAAQWLTPRASQCGVSNSYADPAQLGADRWAALIAARHLHTGPGLVVNAGTATTIDVLSAEGVFSGGVILPGLDLMKRSLAAGTAGLPLASGSFAEEPRTTADAIESGALQAHAGAIERMFTRLPKGGLGGVCFLSGGSALKIAGRLTIPVRVIENLVLEGLVRIVA
ncbi:MAG: type III pantothenate kinase [Betaproteobacteria bacterium]|nr:type III pantothenate kinase [Betaproteobacteria bacterium]